MCVYVCVCLMTQKCVLVWDNRGSHFSTMLAKNQLSESCCHISSCGHGLPEGKVGSRCSSFTLALDSCFSDSVLESPIIIQSFAAAVNLMSVVSMREEVSDVPIFVQLVSTESFSLLRRKPLVFPLLPVSMKQVSAFIRPSFHNPISFAPH